MFYIVNGGHKLHVFTQVPLRHVSDKGYSQIDITSKVTEILLIQRNTALLVSLYIMLTHTYKVLKLCVLALLPKSCFYNIKLCTCYIMYV